jgi:RHS repeat-associated protein
VRSRRRRVVSKVIALAVPAVIALSGCGGGGGLDAGSNPGQPPSGSASKDPVYYFHNDRLGTPLRLTNEQGQVVWRAEYRPFGDLAKQETNPSGLGNVQQPLRFSGQYDDVLSSLILAQGPYYNWNRYYEPGTGRYLQDDPAKGDPAWQVQLVRYGMSDFSFSYAQNNPTRHVDSTGRFIKLGYCPNFDQALEWVRSRAGCDPDVPFTSPAACNCTTRLKACAPKCDICSVLTPGVAPISNFIDSLTNPETKQRATGLTYSLGTNVFRVDLESQLCFDTTMTGWLAESILHEAMHVCSRQTNGKVRDDPPRHLDSCDPANLVKQCGFR